MPLRSTGLVASLPHAVAFRLRRPPLSLRLRPRVLVVGVGAAGVLVLVVAFALTLGDYPVAFGDIARILVGGEADARTTVVVRLFRLPRVLTAVAAGAALGMSGQLFQRLLRNPLVAPDVIGVTAGATVVAVAWTVTAGAVALLPVAAFVGAAAATAVILALAWRRGAGDQRLILVGIGIHAALTAVTNYLIVRFPLDRVVSAVVWQAGSLVTADWQAVRMLALGLGLLVPLALLTVRPLQALELGPEVAAGVGTAVDRARVVLLLTAAGLAAVATAAVGPVPFVALVAPHVARLLAGAFGAGVLVLSGLVGALLLVASDAAAQHTFSPIALPAGVATAALGAPYFLFLLYRSNRER